MQMNLLSRKIIVGLLLLFLFTMNSGCSNPAQTFQQASEKTEKIQRGQLNFSLDMELKYTDKVEAKMKDDNFTPLTLESITLNERFDREAEISRTHVVTKINGLGIEGTIYQKGKEFYLVSPFLPAILVIEEGAFENMDLPEMAPLGQNQMITELPYAGLTVTEETKNSLQKLWGSLLKDKEVSHLGNVILSTPDGDVKAKEYTVKLTPAQLQLALQESLKIIENDESLKEHFSQTDFLDQVLENIRQWVGQAELGPINYKAFIDRDGYIIHEIMEVKMEATQEDSINSGLESFLMSFEIKRFAIGKAVEINFPTITAENSIKLNDLKDINESDFLGFPALQEKERNQN